MPPSWARATSTPSFLVALHTHEAGVGLVQALNDSLVCLRPPVTLANGTSVPEQALTVTNGSETPGTHFAHEGESGCESAGVTWLVQGAA